MSHQQQLHINGLEEVLIRILTTLSPGELLIMIENDPITANLVRRNLDTVVSFYRCHPDFLDKLIWFNFNNTYEGFMGILRMHEFISGNDEYFIELIARHAQHIIPRLIVIPANLYKFKLFAMLLSRRLNYSLTFYLVNNYIWDREEENDAEGHLEMLLELFVRYPNVFQFESTSDDNDNIGLLYDVLDYFVEARSTNSLFLAYDVIDNMIARGARTNDAFKYLLEPEDTRQRYIYYLDFGFSSQNASYLVENPPQQHQIEVFSLMRLRMAPDKIFDIMFNRNTA
jgi:hypothetical protein